MTVSRVLNRIPSVAAEKRRSVLEAMRILNYSPSDAARHLAGRRAHRIAVPYGNPSTGYMSEFLLGALKASSSFGTQLIVEQFADGDSAEAVVDRLRAGGSQGVVLPPPLCEWRALVDRLLMADIPAVAVAGAHGRAQLPCIRIDNELAAQELTRHLLDEGHRHFGFITGPVNQSASAERFAGFLAALDQAGLAREFVQVEPGDFTYRSGLLAAARLLGGSRPPSAVFAANDDMAAATSMVAHRLGIEVPADLSIVGFDDTALATTIWPALTTVHQPIAEMAARALNLLVQRLQREGTAATVLLDEVVPHRICVRQSTAPRAKRAAILGLESDHHRPAAAQV